MAGIIPGVSLLGQSTANINRLNYMSRQMNDLQRQIGTQKRYDTMTGFGLDTQRILQLHGDHDQIKAYSSNIDHAVNNITTMSDTFSKVIETLNNLVSILQSQPRDAEFNAELVGSEARNAIDFITDITNLNVGGRYLFAGTDALTAPVADTSTLNANFAAEINSWMNGTNTTGQLLTNSGNFSGAALGLSTSIFSAQKVSVRISTETEITYGAIADRSGVQEALRALGFMANLRAPDPAVDIPTDADFSTAIDQVLVFARNAIRDMQSTLGSMSGALTLASSIQETHKMDINIFAGQIEKAENIDAAEIIAMLQALQTQLTASYEATRISSQLSLANYIR